MYLLRMQKFPHDALNVFLCCSFWVTCDRFNVGLQISLQQLVDFAIVVVIMTYTIHTVDVIPNSPTERCCVHICVMAHPVKTIQIFIFFDYLIGGLTWHSVYQL